MITQSVYIKNFKSIKDLQFFPKKLNIFIGEPNSGKSNIMEALSCLSADTFQSTGYLKQLIRFENLGNLFYDFNLSEPIQIETDHISCELEFTREGLFIDIDDRSRPGSTGFIGTDGELQAFPDPISGPGVKPYSFKRLDRFELDSNTALSVPSGANIPGLLLSNSALKDRVSSFLNDRNFKLTLNPAKNEVSVSKVIGEAIYTYPYSTISETLQRIIFMMLAMESNKNSILIFDEPEANTFPYFTKYIAEQIAFDTSNQFFISTHNPYLLSAIVEKANIEDLAVYITQMDGQYQTQLTKIDDDKMGQILDLSSDVFFNLDKFLHE